MRSFTVIKDIQVSQEDVWLLLTDTEIYNSWSDRVEKIEGKIALGEDLKISREIEPNRLYIAKITEFIPKERMVWTFSTNMGFLFKRRRILALTAKGASLTEFSMQEIMNGPISPIKERSYADLYEPFQDFATGLKKRAEGVR